MLNKKNSAKDKIYYKKNNLHVGDYFQFGGSVDSFSLFDENRRLKKFRLNKQKRVIVSIIVIFKSFAQFYLKFYLTLTKCFYLFSSFILKLIFSNS